MAVDYRINLAKEMTSSVGERNRFYSGMLIYLIASAIALILVTYLGNRNMTCYVDNTREYNQLLGKSSEAFGLDVSAFRNAENIYTELEAYSVKIQELKNVLGQRVPLLPVVHNLFIELPAGVTVQSLSAHKSLLSFGLIMPPPSKEVDPVRNLRASWEANKELMRSVATIRPVTGERRTIENQSVFYVQFECVLNK